MTSSADWTLHDPRLGPERTPDDFIQRWLEQRVAIVFGSDDPEAVRRALADIKDVYR